MKLRDMETPMVLGHELVRHSLTPRRVPVGVGPFSMGDIIRYKSISLGVLGPYHHGKIVELAGPHVKVQWPRRPYLCTEHPNNLCKQ